MGLSLHYRGRLVDIQQINIICEELIDIATTMNWPWVSLDEDWSRPANATMVTTGQGIQIKGYLSLKGVAFTVNPKCESLRFFFDSEGNLRDPISLTMILEGNLKPEDAWVSVKTQFSSPETHIWIIGLLKYLKKRYIPDLQVLDEGEYWETGNRETLKEKMDFIAGKIDMIANELSCANVGDISGCSDDEIASIIEELLDRTLKSSGGVMERIVPMSDLGNSLNP
ncbi:MAG: hypothetical protein ABIF11_11380 [Nitrospirota bacterium]